jgi:hypothetical protein
VPISRGVSLRWFGTDASRPQPAGAGVPRVPPSLGR